MRLIITTILLSISVSGRSQSLDYKYQINIWPEKTDTTYYDSKQIKTITFTARHSEMFSCDMDRILLKIIYQYDECSNLRNITRQYKVYVNPQLYGILSPSPYVFEDNLIENVNCDKKWVKPLLFF